VDEYETDGKFKKYKKPEGYFPFIIYEKENVGIVYEVDLAGNLTIAIAMTVKETLDRLARFHAAAGAMSKTMAN
jgi:hypothetical protein